MDRSADCLGFARPEGAHRTPRQNDGRRPPGSSAERHVWSGLHDGRSWRGRCVFGDAPSERGCLRNRRYGRKASRMPVMFCVVVLAR